MHNAAVFVIAMYVSKVIRVYDDAGDVVETYEHAGDFKEPPSGETLRLIVKCCCSI